MCRAAEVDLSKSQDRTRPVVNEYLRCIASIASGNPNPNPI